MTKVMSRRLLTLAASSVLLLAACGGGDEDETAEVATLQATQSGGGAAADAAVREAEGPADLDPDEAALQFSQCMRDEGLDFPDLSVDADGNIELRSAFQTIERDTEDFRDAMDVCGDILQQTGFGGGRGQLRESTEFQDALVGFSECLRDEGYDVGDLTLGAPGQGQDQGAQDGDGAGQGSGQGGGQQGERGQGFGNRGVRFAENLGLDYEDPDVAEAVDGCLVIVDEALADLGVGTGPGQG